MFIQELWRYPVKSMGGESLQSTRVTTAGIEGDRIVQIRTEDWAVATARSWPDLLGFHAKLNASGEPMVDGKAWTDPRVLQAVRTIVGAGAQLVHDESLDRFDVLPLLIATDGAITALGRDRRRLRPNIVIGGVEGLAEREWEGGQMTIGDVVISIDKLRQRCNMTMVDPDTLDYDPSVLRDIVKRFAGLMALNCAVVSGGDIRVGQEVRVAPLGL